MGTVSYQCSRHHPSHIVFSSCPDGFLSVDPGFQHMLEALRRNEVSFHNHSFF